MNTARIILATIAFCGGITWTASVLGANLVHPSIIVASLAVIAYGAVRAADEDLTPDDEIDVPPWWLRDDDMELPYVPPIMGIGHVTGWPTIGDDR